MRRYLRIYRAFLSSAFRRELEFRANFFAKVFRSLAWVFFFIMALSVLYSNTTDVAGWSHGEALILTAIVQVFFSASYGVFFGLIEIPEQVRKGSLDFVLTKPVDSQFWVSCRRFDFDQIVPFFAGIVMLFVGLNMSGIAPGALQWAGFVAMLLSAVAIVYSMNLFLMTMGIWFVRVDNLWVLGETVLWMARYPTDIYSLFMRQFLVFALPFAFLATLPAKQLTEAFNGPMVALSWMWALGLFVATRLFWVRAQNSYSSASS